MTTFTASEVRELAKHMESVGWRPDSKGNPECYDEGAARSAEILFAYADLLEADEKAVPVMVVNHVSSAEHDLPIGMKLYAHPVPADAERLAEALKRAFEHLASIGYPENARGNYDKDGEWTFSDAVPRDVDAREVSAAFHALKTALAAQENPNG